MSNFTLFLGSLALLSAACGPGLVPTRSDDRGTTIADERSGSTGSPSAVISTLGVPWHEAPVPLGHEDLGVRVLPSE